MNIVSARQLEGRTVLALDTGMTPRAFAQSRFSLVLGSGGFVLDPAGTVEPWIPEGTFFDETRARKKMLVYGREFAGTPLLEAITCEDREAAWRRFHHCTAAINRAFLAGTITPEALTAMAGAGPESVLVAEDGRILVLPFDVYTRCLAGQGEKVEIENRLLWIHPDYRTLNPSWAFSFMAGTLAYRIAAGKPPFSSEENMKAEELAFNTRNGVFEPLELAVWSIRPAAAACINSLISTGIATGAETLLAFGPAYDGILDPAREGMPESAEFLKTKASSEKKRTGRMHRKNFFRRNRSALMVAGIAAAVIAVLAGSWLRDLAGRPTTKGLNSVEVVAGYYAAIESLDQEIPQAYTARDVKPDYTEFTTNLFVTSKVRQAYEQNTGIISPARLFALRDIGNFTVYGMTGLSIARVSENDTKAEYEVSFYLWMPFSESAASGGEGGVRLSVHRYRDMVSLEYRKEMWVITAIRNSERRQIEGDGAKLMKAVSDKTADAFEWAPTPEEIAQAAAPAQN